MLTPNLKEPSDLLNKLLREQHRAFHANHADHVADHLYNFCITALALRDHVFVALDYNADKKAAFHVRWRDDVVRIACSEIANTSKHAELRH
jgi:hypothetical protein